MRKSLLTFCGGVDEVTGSNFLLEDANGGSSENSCKILIDCGLAQGDKFASLKNERPFPYDPSRIHFLLVTHAHIDHIGRIPKLVRDGFRGQIISTPETEKLAKLMLADALRVMQSEALKENREPLYDEDDISRSFALWRTEIYHTPFSLCADYKAVFLNAGHVLGSAMIEIYRDGEKIVFSGDLGNSPTPFLSDTEDVSGIKYLVMESVYGDRTHEDRQFRRKRLQDVIEKTRRKKGTLLIPAFSLEKTQVILFELNSLIEKKEIENIPVFLDSPLAEAVTSVYRSMHSTFNPEAKKAIASGDDIFSFPKLKITKSGFESMKIANAPDPKIIIAGSGMSTGGRIIRHEKEFLPHIRNTILFVGYQSPGSLGREIQDGAKAVDIESERVNIRAEVETISGYSSHKDGDHLLEFVSKSAPTLKQVFAVMGEPKSALFLVQRIRDYLGVDASHPKEGSAVFIEL